MSDLNEFGCMYGAHQCVSAAKELKECDKEIIKEVGTYFHCDVPGYILVCFGIEFALKSYLASKGCYNDRLRHHRLINTEIRNQRFTDGLFNACVDCGLDVGEIRDNFCRLLFDNFDITKFETPDEQMISGWYEKASMNNNEFLEILIPVLTNASHLTSNTSRYQLRYPTDPGQPYQPLPKHLLCYLTEAIVNTIEYDINRRLFNQPI